MVFNQDGTVAFGDLTLAPIISQWDFRVAIIDFDLAMKFDPRTDPSTWVSTSGLGTLPYNSPEKSKAGETGTSFQVLPADVSGLFRLIYVSRYLLACKIYALGASFKHLLDIEKDTIDRGRHLVSLDYSISTSIKRLIL
jgi:serine/threonine protein kinase